MKNKKRKMENLLLFIAGGIFIGCAIWLLRVYFGYQAGANEYQEIYENLVETIVVSEESTLHHSTTDNVYVETAETEATKLQVNFDALKEINSDVVGWIDIPGLNISYPVVQAEDNQYYLDKTFRNEKNIAGSIYMDFRNQPDMSDKNTIIHGHNMKNRTMFGNLKKYSEKGIADENSEFYFYTPNQIYRCELISFRTVSAVLDEYPTTFETEEEFHEFVRNAKRNSWYEFSTKIEDVDKMITLSTCASSDTSRFIVQARLVEVGAE